MILFTFHIFAIGLVIGITSFFAFSLGKKEGLSIARKEQEIKPQTEALPEIESQ
jgi:Na+-driven multidrug efflux pump